MPPVAQSIAQLLRRQAQSVLQTNTPLVIGSSLRQPLQQKRTIFSQQLPRTLKRRQPTAQRFGNRPVNRQQQTRFSSSSSSSSSAKETAQRTQQQARSLSQRLKDLSRQYGWSAVGVYFALSALDFPFCFAAVRFFGVERIGHYEHVVVEGAKNWFYSVVPLERQIEGDQQQELEHDDSHAIASAEGATDEGASIWTQLAIAYAVHKSLIFFRVPLTAAVTPKIVKTLRGWGWNIGKKVPKTTK